MRKRFRIESRSLKWNNFTKKKKSERTRRAEWYIYFVLSIEYSSAIGNSFWKRLLSLVFEWFGPFLQIINYIFSTKNQTRSVLVVIDFSTVSPSHGNINEIHSSIYDLVLGKGMSTFFQTIYYYLTSGILIIIQTKKRTQSWFRMFQSCANVQYTNKNTAR